MKKINKPKIKKVDTLIVGGGPAGVLAALTQKTLLPKSKILLVKNEKNIVIRCSEPYVIGHKAKINQIVHPDEAMLQKNGVSFLVDEVVDFLNFPQKRIALTKKGLKIEFRNLVLATGAKPFVPPIPGILKNKNAFTLRSAADARKISRALEKSKRIVVIGGGAIGIEVAALSRERKKDVTILEIAEQLMPGAYDADYAEKVKGILEEKGIRIYLGVKVKEVKKKVIVTSKGNIDYDVILCSCGVRANVDLAKKLNCRLGKFGIVVNQFCQTSQEHVWAAGDCAQVRNLITKKLIPSQLATTAVAMGKIVGMNIVAKKMKFQGVLNPAVSCFFQYAVGRVGLTERAAKKEGLKIKVTQAHSVNQYPSQKTSMPLDVKLIFNKKNNQLVGAQIFGGKKDIGMRINLLSLAISQHLDAGKLAQLNYCAHPEETPLPFAEPIVMAAEGMINDK